MFCTDLAHPTLWIFSEAAPALLYYTHLPIVVMSLFMGLFIFLKNRRSVPAQALLFISFMFSLYLVLDLTTWTLTSVSLKMFTWSLLFSIQALMYAGTAYFVYSFMEGEDAPFKWKLLVIGLVSPLIIFLPTKFTLSSFDFYLCEGMENLALYYEYFFEGVVSIWLVTYLVRKFLTGSGEIREKAKFLFFGVTLFLISLLGTNIWGSVTRDWKITQYGFFGVLVFLAVLAYLVVRYGAFNIKLLGAQVLVWALGFSVFSLFFIDNLRLSEATIAVTLLFVVMAGLLLVRSVKRQVEQSEKLKHLTLSLQDLTENLQEKVDEQTKELKQAYEVEKKARRDLEELDQMKDKFILTTQHQMRTPLSGIKWTLNMLINGDFGALSPEQKSYLSKAYESNDHMISLINDMLGAVRIEAMKAGEMVPVDLSLTLERVLADLDSQAKRKKIEIKVEKPKKLPKVLFEPEKIRAVFQNTIENAVRYSHSGGVVEVSLAEKGNDIIVTVSDNGIGIPKEQQGSISQRFFRGTNAVKAQTEGTGLGLFIAKSMIEISGGKMWFESEENKGTKFFFQIPTVKM